MIKKIIIQFLIASMFCAIVIFASNYVLSMENMEILKITEYRNNIDLLTSVNDNKIKIADIGISLLFFILFAITAFKTIIYKNKINKPWSKQTKHLIQMVATVIAFTGIQFVYLNVKEFNNGMLFSIHSFYIPAMIIAASTIITIILVFGRIGVDYILPVKEKYKVIKTEENSEE